jgi:hypothetical protein
LNKLGIGLLLFGVALLYLLSVERGWIGPPVRVGFGLAVGAALLVMGLRVYENRRTFAQVLLGGGIGAFYITGFAAFQLYALIPYVVAFTFMVAVTLLAFFLSLSGRTGRRSRSLPPSEDWVRRSSCTTAPGSWADSSSTRASSWQGRGLSTSIRGGSRS